MGLTVGTVLECAADAAPSRTAVTLGDVSRTFAELRGHANALANALHGWGLRRGDRVAYWASTNLDAPPFQFALGRLGAAFAPLNHAYEDDEARAALEYLVPRLLVADPDHAARAEALACDLDIPVATLGGRGPGASLDDLADAAATDSVSAPLPHEDDTFTIFLTSGSTGRPKGVMVSQRATWLRTYAGATTTVTTGGRGELLMFPFFHMAGWTFAYYAWSAHRTAHLVTRADADELLAAVERYRPASLYCIPAVWERLLAETTTVDASSLEWALIGTSRVEPELLSAIKDRFPGVRMTVSYGSTEMGRAISLGDDDLFRKPCAVGLPIPGVRAEVADDGELLLTGETMTSGYFQLPEETSAAIVDGWYRTGDRAEQDEEGYFSIVGRVQEIIRSGGEWVAPVEVEAALADLPNLVAVAVVGLPDTSWGEVVCAAVVVAPGAPPPTVDDVRAHLAGRLAPYKHPRRVIVVDEIPRTAATGQVRRTLLAREARP
ncbi:MAG TPA: class I adenylate-forming enzyme family protein [Acidimicrobiia bacterium]